MKALKISNKVYYIIMSVFVIILMVMLIITQGECLTQFLFHSREDRYMDFFNSIRDCWSDDPYGFGCIYPPLTYVVYQFFGRFLPMDIRDKYDFRDQADCMMMYLIYCIVIAVLMIVMICKFLKGQISTKALFCVTLLFSTPIIAVIDRGNIVWLSMIFLLIYIFTYDSENKIWKEIGLISLAIATAFKIYPVVFGVLLLTKERWKDALRCVLYGAIFFFVPYICFNGFSDFIVMLNNIVGTSQFLGNSGHGYRVNFSNTLLGAFSLLQYRGPRIDVVIHIGIYGLYILMFSALVLTKCKWKKIFLLSAVIVGLPPFSYMYAILYLVAPLILFLNENKDSKWDRIYAVCFAFCFAPMGFNIEAIFGKATVPYMLTLNVFVMAIAFMLLTVLVSIEVWIDFVKSGKRLKG